jgi:hypothetical protein
MKTVMKIKKFGDNPNPLGEGASTIKGSPIFFNHQLKHFKKSS